MPCNRCGFCCLYLTWVFPRTKAIKQWAAARGFSLIQESETHMELALRHPCKHLRIYKHKDGKKEASCLIHENMQYPERCSKMPANRAHGFGELGLDQTKSMPPICGYKYNKTTGKWE